MGKIMSSVNSNLSSSQYGYDFVVATTQASINATMDEYISGLESPVVTMCYVMDQAGNPQVIDYATLITQAKGTDPFSVANGASLTSEEVQNLSGVYFMYAFKAQIGLPPGYAPLTQGGPALPTIVTLGSNTASVTYNLMCSEFTVVEASYGPRGIVSWLNQSQPSAAAWIFTSQVDLRLTPTSVYGSLPAAVQAQIKNLGGNAFSVQQLLFDLNNAALESVPTISGVTPGTPLYTGLQSAFIGAYFSELQKAGQPVLAYSIAQSTAPPASLTLTNLNMEVNPYMGTNGQAVAEPSQQQQGLATLCYLCAANGNTLPAATAFSWNWIDATESSSYDGVIAINRNTFAKYFQAVLSPYVARNCYQSYVKLTLSGTTVNYGWSLKPGQTPTSVFPAAGSTVLTMTYSSSNSDQAGLDGALGSMTMTTSMNVTVEFTGSAIIITQHLVVYLDISGVGDHLTGNIVDKTITDTYTLSVNATGGLIATLQTNSVNNSQLPQASAFANFFTDDNNIMDAVAGWVNTFTGTKFTDIPVTAAQSFVFPGGNTFTYEDVAFSDNQDLVSHITYVQPS